MKYFDMHCHILPELDDGSGSVEETRQMLQIAYKEGIRAMVATPHHHPKRGKATMLQKKEALKVVRDIAKEISEDFRIYLGTEIYYASDHLTELKAEKIPTMAGSKYALVEFSPGDTFHYIQQGLQMTQSAGYLPIIAHPERYDCMLDEPEHMEYLAEMGVYIQINAASVTGKGGRDAKKLTRWLLKNELVTMVGTDAHGAKHRAPEMKTCAKYIEKHCEKGYAANVLWNNGVRVIKNIII